MQRRLPFASPPRRAVTPLGDGVALLAGCALPDAPALLDDLAHVTGLAPFRHQVTPGGFRMSVAMTSCGDVGWVSDTRGYRYDTHDPDTGQRWPAMPASFVALARRASTLAGFPAFEPDACLVNRYAPGARLALHQDRDELDFTAPIVSVSLGLPAVFLLGGSTRAIRPKPIALEHGDVVVWGGPSRMAFHGVMPLADGEHEATGALRINLTFRKAR